MNGPEPLAPLANDEFEQHLAWDLANELPIGLSVTADRALHLSAADGTTTIVHLSEAGVCYLLQQMVELVWKQVRAGA